MSAMNLAQLTNLINTAITVNGTGAITGPILNNVLTQIVASLVEPNQVPIIAPGVTAGLPTDGDVLVNVAGAVTYDLVNAGLALRPVCIKDISGNASINNITIVPFGTQTIDGANSSVSIISDNGSFTLVPLASGTGWYIK